MNKKILLVEPTYRTKYPPLGLMKLSTYHKGKGDEVAFVKGCDKKAGNIFWDRVYISSLFTWTWKETIKTIAFYNDLLFHFSGKIYVGGILASLMPDEIFNATGIHPIVGLLDNPQKIDQDDKIIIDRLPPDYDIVKQVENESFTYNNTDAYLGYASRGCIRKCSYCAVKTLEPKFIPYINVTRMVNSIKKIGGDKQNLLLMDNNILASSKFDAIIDDIKTAGFRKGATYGTTRRKRKVDFNQGLDARLLTESKMKRLSEIPLDPMRVAFDDIKYESTYVQAVRLAHKYGQKNMSNYVLYNYKDTPEDFYKRLKINIDLNIEFASDKNGEKTIIYSFPMRFIPLNATDRNIDTGNLHWNKQYLRAIKIILNVTKGPVMPGAEFFYQAFGSSEKEFKSILLMPDDFIRNRVVPNWRQISCSDKRLMPYVRKWKETYFSMSKSEEKALIRAVGPRDVDFIKKEYKSSKAKKVKALLKAHLDPMSFMINNNIKIIDNKDKECVKKSTMPFSANIC